MSMIRIVEGDTRSLDYGCIKTLRGDFGGWIALKAVINSANTWILVSPTPQLGPYSHSMKVIGS